MKKISAQTKELQRRKKLERPLTAIASFFDDSSSIASPSRHPIAVDGGSFLQEMPDGSFTLWEQQNFPASAPIASLERADAKKILEGGPAGRKLLRDIYERYRSGVKQQTDREESDETLAENSDRPRNISKGIRTRPVPPPRVQATHTNRHP